MRVCIYLNVGLFVYMYVCMPARVCTDVRVRRAAEAVATLPGSEERPL